MQLDALSVAIGGGPTIELSSFQCDRGGVEQEHQGFSLLAERARGLSHGPGRDLPEHYIGAIFIGTGQRSPLNRATAEMVVMGCLAIEARHQLHTYSRRYRRHSREFVELGHIQRAPPAPVCHRGFWPAWC